MIAQRIVGLLLYVAAGARNREFSALADVASIDGQQALRRGLMR